MNARLTIAISLCCLLSAGILAADEAADYADKMISRLAAWKIDATKKNLVEKQQDLGSTAAFKTAWGLLQASEGQLDAGLATLKQAADAAPKDPAPEVYRAGVLDWKRDFNAAKGAWKSAHDRAKAAVKASPQDPRANYYLGTALVGLQKYGEAREALNKALANGFDPAMVNYQLGLSYAMQQNWKAAEEHLSKVIAADDRFAYAYYHRGRVWDKLGRKDKMLNDLDRFVKLAPKAPDAEMAQTILGASGR